MKIQQYTQKQEALEQAVDSMLSSIDREIDIYVSGGSSFAVFGELNSRLTKEEKAKLRVFQVDERFGEVGHKEANANLFTNLNLEDYAKTTLILRDGLNRDEATDHYKHVVEESLNSDRFKIAILGLGEDGHVAGVKPVKDKEGASRLFAGRLVAGYQSEDYERITITPDALRKFDQLIVFASGPDKGTVINLLEIGDLPDHFMPAQMLGDIENVEIYHSEE